MNRFAAIVTLALASVTLVHAQSVEQKSVLQFHKQPPAVSHRMSVAMQTYLREGKFIPAYKGYNSAEYSSGFHDGMSLAISLESDGTDFRLKTELKGLCSKSREYAAGFYSALEAYHAVSVLAVVDSSSTEQTVPEKTVRVRDIQRNGKVKISGHLGMPVGTMVKLKGKRARALKTTNAKTLHVESINGEAFKPDRGYSPYIQIANVDALPEGKILAVEGYEFIEWSGDPARNWHLDASFVITKVNSSTPNQLKFFELKIRPSQGRLVRKP